MKRIDQVFRDMGLVFQNFSLFPQLVVLKNCTLSPIWIRKKLFGMVRETAIRYLERIKIRHLVHKFPGQISGGQQ